MEETKPAAVESKKRKADTEDKPAKKAKSAEVEEEEEESKTVWVGQLSWNVDDAWLKTEFEEYGEVVSARVVMDRDSGRSRGCVAVQGNIGRSGCSHSFL